jgi:HK97 family phage major capsid protein
MKELQERRNTLAAKIKGMADSFNANDKRWEDDSQRTAWDELNADYDSTCKQQDEVRTAEEIACRTAAIEAEQERAAKHSRSVPDFGGEDVEGYGRRDGGISRHDREVSIASWFKRQAGLDLSKPEREACRRAGMDPSTKWLDVELSPTHRFKQMQHEFRDRHPALLKRDLNVTTATDGQETIPQGFVPRLERAMLAFGGMLQVAEVMNTASGNDLPWPTANDTTNKGALLAEATTIGSSVDPAFSSVTLEAFKYSSKPVLVSAELLQDSAFDLNQILADMLGERLGRILNEHFTTGTGSAQPNGIVTAAATGVTGGVSATPAITGDNLIDLIHSVDPAYRTGARFMMADSTIALVRKLKDGDNQYLWQPGLQAGVPDRLLGYSVTINQDMADPAASAKSVLFGDLSKYKIRQVRGIRMRRLVERYADTDQEAFIAFIRADGDLLDAGVDPVKLFVHGAAA